MFGAVVHTPPEQTIVRKPWPLWLLAAFRFVCAYWVLYAALNVAYRYAAGQILSRLYMAQWRQFWLWATAHVFHITGRVATYVPTPSGDTTLQYVQQAMFLGIALGAALVWSLLDRRRNDYRALHSWLRLLVRYMLALILFGYGFAKLFPQQFPPLTFARLVEPYGEFSPMGALWSFMATSRPYAVFTGAIEVTGGLLLLFRRTTTLGALVSTIAMTNVVALNFCYDVPVKLHSTNILLMAMFLLLPDLRRLANVLVFNRPAEAADLSAPRFERPWANVLASVFWLVFVGYSLERQVGGNIGEYRSLYANPDRPPLHGIYEVENDYRDWRLVAVDNPRVLPATMMGAAMTVRTKEDAVLHFSIGWAESRLTLNKKDVWTWSQPDANHVLLQKDRESIRLRKVDVSSLPLMSRGFHWINETAINY
jgi:uncharacterized membrane protein YphA (DoxX/SURF4 family)